VNSRWFAYALVAAAFLGWALASLFPQAEWLFDTTRVLQTAFLAALKMIIAPLIFFSLMSGVMQLREAKDLGRLGGVTLSYYLLTSLIAIAVGLFIVFFVHPWTAQPPLVDTDFSLPDTGATLLSNQDGKLSTIIAGLLTALLSNPFTALAELNILGILFSAILFGLAATMVLPKESKWPGLIDELTQIIFRAATWVLSCLPIGLFAIAHQLTAKIELSTLVSLAQFSGVVLGATAFHGFIVLPLIAWLLTGVGPITLFKAIGQPMFTALITSSSAATLPLSLAAAKDRLQVPQSTAAFVLPLGATINMDGTALFEGIAVIFLAYMFGIELTALSIFVVFLVTMLASAGAPGIPSGSMAGMQIVMLAVGIPLEAIALLLLIERPLDTFRTAINVEGDLIGALVAKRWAGSSS